ncbi:MAG: hypothetical protein LBE71_05755, partial [Dysgonamonadaceae bacterium]|nr:hypothetical protein [Dysgonamonadaceae bacterium]
MKQTISFITLIALLLTTVQPSIAFHYCKGELQSVDFVKKDMPKSCCEENHAGCCSDEYLQIKTNDFSILQTYTDIQPPVLPQQVFFTVNVDLIFPCDIHLLLQQIFP